MTNAKTPPPFKNVIRQSSQEAASAIANETTPIGVGIRFQCSNCKQPLDAPHEMAGETVSCPACNNSLIVQFAAKEKKETWLSWLALTTVILALCATMATFKGAGYSTKTMLTQTQAADQRAFYQAKSIKGYLYELHREKLQLDLKAMGPSFSPQAVTDHANQIDAAGIKIKKYEEEKDGIQKKGKELEAFLNQCYSHSAAFGMGVIFLQLAIVLSSIAALLKRRVLWYAGLLVGVWGLVHFANGFYLFL
jgi:DNA-directed RNA polymerase subunit RPC12/RpoP